MHTHTHSYTASVWHVRCHSETKITIVWIHDKCHLAERILCSTELRVAENPTFGLFSHPDWTSYDVTSRARISEIKYVKALIHRSSCDYSICFSASVFCPVSFRRTHSLSRSFSLIWHWLRGAIQNAYGKRIHHSKVSIYIQPPEMFSSYFYRRYIFYVISTGRSFSSASRVYHSMSIIFCSGSIISLALFCRCYFRFTLNSIG